MQHPRHILITGASSGLGAALARHYAGPGIVLYLQGRNAERLEAVAGDCREKQAVVHMAIVDVTDARGMERWLKEADDKTPLDLIFANAGISAGTGGHEGETTEQVKRLFATNIDGVVNTVSPLIPAMIARGRGQVGIVSSLAGFKGLPSSPAYSASKSCVRVWAEGLRGWLSPFGIEVNAICPGFIKTPMTDINPYHMPLMLKTDKAAAIIARGLARNKSRIAFPLGLYLPLWLMTALSPTITDPLFARLPAKPAVKQ